MITTPIIKNDTYEKILAFLDPEKYKTEAEKDPFKQKYRETKKASTYTCIQTHNCQHKRIL
jgi:hypothetical protein